MVGTNYMKLLNNLQQVMDVYQLHQVHNSDRIQDLVITYGIAPLVREDVYQS